MNQNATWKRVGVAAFMLAGALVLPVDAQAGNMKGVSGLMGAQDTQSKELLALSPEEANQVAMRDLTSLLTPVGKFTLDNSRNVEGMVFNTRPYWTTYRYVCRRDRVTLEYGYRFDPTSKEDGRQPLGVTSQPTYHIEQLPVPGFIPGTSYKVTECDAIHPGPAENWFAAPGDRDAVRAANMFRMAVDEVKAGRLTPGPCDSHSGLSCRQWLQSLDDLSKIISVEPCATDHDKEVCYTVSFGSIDVTITGRISGNDMMAITPAAITSVRVEDVVVFMY